MLLDDDLKREQIALAERAFVEENFDYGSDKETIKNNYFKSIDLFHQKYADAFSFCERVDDGEKVDDVELNQLLQEVVFSYRLAKRFRDEYSGSGNILNPANIKLSNDSVENAVKGNEMLGKYALSHNLDDYETGKWYLFSSVN